AAGVVGRRAGHLELDGPARSAVADEDVVVPEGAGGQLEGRLVRGRGVAGDLVERAVAGAVLTDVEHRLDVALAGRLDADPLTGPELEQVDHLPAVGRAVRLVLVARDGGVDRRAEHAVREVDRGGGRAGVVVGARRLAGVVREAELRPAVGL